MGPPLAMDTFVERPDPDELLARVRAAEDGARRGELRIFFGYAAGVGKTYAMLEAARKARAEGRDVVVGYVEPHARPETEALREGLESVPPRSFEHRGVVFREFDVDAALQRHPEVLLVDELAHTNAEGSRHEKRWQDIDELRDAGIHVWSTLNVQHIESLNDVVGQITGVVVRETIPDQVFDGADAIELVDLTPDELLGRLEAGKVYLPEQARRALRHFFQKGNLDALRELSLRQTARRVHTDVESARRRAASLRPWATTDRLLVCVGPSPTTARVIRTARRMAAALDAPWLAVSVDVAGMPENHPSKVQIARHFKLAESLGAETVTLAGQRVVETILEFARARNVTKILVGKTKQPRWRRLAWRTLVDELVETSGEIDVYVIHGEPDGAPVLPPAAPATPNWQPYLVAAAAVALAAGISGGLRAVRFADSEANMVMPFLAATCWTAFRHGRGPALFASIAAVLLFDFCFVPPTWTFAVADARYVPTFLVMLAIGLAIASLTARLRAQVDGSRHRERRAAALYELGKQLGSLSGEVFLAAAAGSKIADLFGAEVVIYLVQPSGPLVPAFGKGNAIDGQPLAATVAQWVVEHERPAGAGTDTLPNAPGLFLPLTGSQRTHGALAIRSAETERLLDPDRRRFLEACAAQLASALERDRLAIEAAEARIEAESERIRGSLLGGVSHDLRTPLAAIAGAADSLLAGIGDETTRRPLLETISEESTRLHRLFENLLQMSRLDAGTSPPDRQWHVLEEIVGTALRRVERPLANRPVTVDLPRDLPLVFVDGLLVEQVFVNLLENVARHTPLETRVWIRAAVDGPSVRITVADDGPGLPPGAERHVFEKFYRAAGVGRDRSVDGARGSGLGLAICRAIVEIHGGEIVAGRRPGGGTEFVVRLPIPADGPAPVADLLAATE